MSDARNDVGTEICIDVLRETFPDIEITSEIPFDRPEGPMIQLSRTGGKDGEFLAEPTMQILLWGSDDASASSMATTAVQSIRAAARDHDSLSSAECTSMERDEWAANGESRYRVQMKLVINL